MEISIDVRNDFNKLYEGEYLNSINKRFVFEDINDEFVSLKIDNNSDEIFYIQKSDLKKLLKIID